MKACPISNFPHSSPNGKTMKLRVRFSDEVIVNDFDLFKHI